MSTQNDQMSLGAALHDEIMHNILAGFTYRAADARSSANNTFLAAAESLHNSISSANIQSEQALRSLENLTSQNLSEQDIDVPATPGQINGVVKSIGRKRKAS